MYALTNTLFLMLSEKWSIKCAMHHTPEARQVKCCAMFHTCTNLFFFRPDLVAVYIMFQIHEMFRLLPLNPNFVLCIWDTLKCIFFCFTIMVYQDSKLVISVSFNLSNNGYIFLEILEDQMLKNISRNASVQMFC